MSGRRLNMTHTAAEDRGPESTGPVPPARRGQAVQGFATFYIPATGYTKILPGRLDLAELWGGASGFGNQQTNYIHSPSVTGMLGTRSEVEFYINMLKPVRSFVAVNGTHKDVFTFGFFGRRYS